MRRRGCSRKWSFLLLDLAPFGSGIQKWRKTPLKVDKMEFSKPKFGPNLATTGMKKWSASGVFYSQIWPSLRVELKSGKKLHLKWSYIVEFSKPSFGPNSITTGMRKCSLRGVFCSQIWPSLGLEVKSGEKLHLKGSYKVVFSKPRFGPNSATTGMKKCSLRGVFCSQIWPSLGLEVKSGEKLYLKWSYKVEFLKPSFGPNFTTTGMKKWSLSGVLCSQIWPSLGVEVKSGEKLQLKCSFAVEFVNPSW